MKNKAVSVESAVKFKDWDYIDGYRAVFQG